MEAQSLSSHQHSWWFSCFSLREKLARSHKKTELEAQLGLIIFNPVAQHELVIRFIIVGIFQDATIG